MRSIEKTDEFEHINDMKVLWLSGNPALYKRKSMIDGGWIGTLQAEIVKQGIDLAIAFPYSSDDEPSDGDGVHYYPLYISKWKKKINKFNSAKIDEHYIRLIKNVIDDFHPDVIHCWGSELCLGLIAKYTDIPVVMHIQGIINPIYEAYCPAGMSGYSILKSLNFNFRKFYRLYYGWHSWMPIQAKREAEIFKNTHYFFGRTDWDRHVTKLLSPSSEYFFCSEALRPAITDSPEWHFDSEKEKAIITTTISSPIYKGADVILKTAKLLKDNTNLDFEWNVYGVSEIKMQERFTGIRCKDVNVYCRGTVDSEQLADRLVKSDVYMHPSYIDNSPNSVCEAQYIGLPVVAQNVGGVATLLKDGAGVLIPSNDAYQAAYYIQKICTQQDYAENLSSKEKEISKNRHDVSSIIHSIMVVYNKICKQ